MFIVERRGAAFGGVDDGWWQFTQEILASDPLAVCGEILGGGADFGEVIAISHWGPRESDVASSQAGHIFVVGAPDDSSVFVFQRFGGRATRAGLSGMGGSFSCLQVLRGGQAFGAAVRS